MENSTRPTMLTIRETARTGLIPETALRRLVKRGECPGFYSGTKFLVNYDRLVAWLNSQTASDSTPSTGGRP